MKKFTSIITITFPSNLAYDEWTKIQNKFFFEDKRVVMFLKENGMTNWTLTKTDDVEPIKVVAIMEYENENSFQKCQNIFSKFMPHIRNTLYKSSVIRGTVIYDII
mgnify:CR=1 FL=1